MKKANARAGAFGPHWHPLALIVLAMPMAWAGGKLRVMRLGAGATQKEFSATKQACSWRFRIAALNSALPWHALPEHAD